MKDDSKGFETLGEALAKMAAGYPYTCPVCFAGLRTAADKTLHMEGVHGYETLHVDPADVLH